MGTMFGKPGVVAHPRRFKASTQYRIKRAHPLGARTGSAEEQRPNTAYRDPRVGSAKSTPSRKSATHRIPHNRRKWRR